MAKDDRLLGLFIALPELYSNEAFVRFLRREGFITNDGLEYLAGIRRDKRLIDNLVKKMEGRNEITRLLSIVPELLTPNTVAILRRFDVVDAKTAETLRLAVLGVRVARGKDDLSLFVKRAAAIAGTRSLTGALQILADSGALAQRDVAILRQATLNAGGILAATGRRMVQAKSLADWMMLLGEGIIDERTIRTMRLTGLIDGRTANVMAESVRYGGRLWVVFEGSKRADGLAARMAYMVSGSLNWELIDVAIATGRLPKKYRYLFKTAVGLSQIYNRRLMEQMTARRYRVRPGESPIATFARAQKGSSRRLLGLLAEAARESSDEAKAMKGLSAAQKRVRTRELHRSMRELWEGIGHLTIFGESQAAEAAVEAAEDLAKGYRSRLPMEVRQMLLLQGKAGVDAYISRQENRVKLSRLVYKNMDLFVGRVDRRVNINLLKGASAEELAKDISRFINPNVGGGVKYAAMRLARTEIANAFHFTTIRHNREMPWVTGFKWNTSGSHGRKDVCDDMAERDHDGLSPGVYRKRNVPGKPHPQCLCYLTVVQVEEEQFISNMKRGFYNSYMKQRIYESAEYSRQNADYKTKATQAMVSYVLPTIASTYASGLRS